jgi:Ca2+-binding EF-hand superfamily protein
MTQRLTALAVAAVLSIGFAVAEDDTSMKSADATFKSLDRDTDQRLSKTEAAGDKMLTEHFAVVDADRDGYLSKTEVTTHIKEMEASKPKKDY